MIKLRPRTLRDALAPFAGAVLVSLWALFTFDSNWFERILLALFLGFIVQGLGLLAYFTASYFSAWLMGEKLDTESIDIYDHRVAGAVASRICVRPGAALA